MTKGIHELAQHLGLSVGTVSRALNDRPEVNENTRRRVSEAALEIGYAPNQSGRSLRKGATNTVGFMIASGTARAVGGDNFFMAVVGGLQTVLAPRNLDLVLLPCRPDEDPYEFVLRMVRRRFVDAVIISETLRHDPRVGLLARSKLPFVALGRSATGIDHVWIDLDFAGVAFDAVERLVAAGHRRIAIAAPDTEVNLGYVFLEGYADALARHGIAMDPDLVMRVDVSEEGGVVLADRVLALQPRPTAVLLINELLAIGLYHRLGQLGLAPGRDLAVVCFRENAQIRFLSPSLSCYRLPLKDLGEALGKAVLSQMPPYKQEYRIEELKQIWSLDYVKGESDLGVNL